MGPEILIVGDRTQRGSLLPRVQDLGYLVTTVRERELTARVEASPAPVAVLICLGDEDPGNLIDAVRSGRDDVPVILYGSLGGVVHDLADVLELGADHFLAEPVGDEELASVLAELAGPGEIGEDPVADGDARGNVLPITQTGGGGPISQEEDPVLGQLHRTLEILAARLQTEAPAPERDGLELAALGLDAVPDVDGGAGHEAELDPDRGRRETSDPAASRRPDSTLRLKREPSGPRRAAPTRTPNIGRGRETDGGTVRLPQRVEVRAATPAVRDEPQGARAGREGDEARGGTQRLDGQRSVGREAEARGHAGRSGVGGAVREDRSAGPGMAVREDRSPGAGPEARGHAGRSAVGMAVREDRSPGAGPEARGHAGRSAVGMAVREDRSSGAGSEVTARVLVRRDVPALAGGERLAGVDVVTRLGRLHRQGGGGRLVVGFTGGAVKQVWWRGGEPVFATSTAATDGLLVRLQARGLVSRADAAQAGRVDGDLIGAARRLVQAGLLKPREQAEAVRDVVESIVLSLCSDAAARWSVDEAAPPAEVDLGVSVLSLLARGVRLGLSDERLREGLAGTTCLRVQVADVRALAEQLDDSDAEAWLGLLDGSRTLDELVAEDGVEARALWSAACVLMAVGLAAPVEPGASLVAIDRRRVSERLALAHASDYFSLLGLARTAGRAEVLRAHADLRATFAPERLEPASRTALADALRELQGALDEARDVLLDEALRTAYRARLEEQEA